MARERMKVGDVGVVLYRGRHGRQYEDVRVVKVGHRWATVEPAHLGRFDANTGMGDGGNYQSDSTFYTPAQIAQQKEVDEARRAVRDAGLEVRMGHSSKWPDDAILALAAWLEGRAS